MCPALGPLLDFPLGMGSRKIPSLPGLQLMVPSSGDGGKGGDCASPVAGSKQWHSLPAKLRMFKLGVTSFRKSLKNLSYLDNTFMDLVRVICTHYWSSSSCVWHTLIQFVILHYRRTWIVIVVCLVAGLHLPPQVMLAWVGWWHQRTYRGKAARPQRQCHRALRLH